MIYCTNRRTRDRSTRPIKVPDRLPSISYSILPDNALRKKLKELGIPSTGSRTLLISRHKEWVDLVNANCDSSQPRGKRDLLSELDVWERAQGVLTHGALNGGNEIMKKDFDSSAWASAHRDGFQDLIARARRKPKYTKEDAVQERHAEQNPKPVCILIPSSPTDQSVSPPPDLTGLPAELSASTINTSINKIS